MCSAISRRQRRRKHYLVGPPIVLGLPIASQEQMGAVAREIVRHPVGASESEQSCSPAFRQGSDERIRRDPFCAHQENCLRGIFGGSDYFGLRQSHRALRNLTPVQSVCIEAIEPRAKQPLGKHDVRQCIFDDVVESAKQRPVEQLGVVGGGEEKPSESSCSRNCRNELSTRRISPTSVVRRVARRWRRTRRTDRRPASRHRVEDEPQLGGRLAHELGDESVEQDGNRGSCSSPASAAAVMVLPEPGGRRGGASAEDTNRDLANASAGAALAAPVQVDPGFLPGESCPRDACPDNARSVGPRAPPWVELAERGRPAAPSPVLWTSPRRPAPLVPAPACHGPAAPHGRQAASQWRGTDPRPRQYGFLGELR